MGPADQNLKPLFGLSKSNTIEALSEQNVSDCLIRYMGGIARSSGLRETDGFVYISHRPSSTLVNETFYETASLTPHSIRTGKRDQHGEEIHHVVIPHWFLPRKAGTYGQADDDMVKSQINERKGQILNPHGPSDLFLVENSDSTAVKYGLDTIFKWRAPKLFHSTNRCPGSVSDTGNSEQPCACFEPGEPVSFRLIFGTLFCGIFSQHPWTVRDASPLMTPEHTLQKLQKTCNREALWSYMACLVGADSRSDTMVNGVRTLAQDAIFPAKAVKALSALSAADMVFDKISRPTISQTCILATLHDMQWIPEARSWSELFYANLDDRRRKELETTGHFFATSIRVHDLPTRAQSFACVAFFDSGHLDLNPDDLENVLAVSSGNSLYVTGKALSDPADECPEYQIHHLVGSIGEKGISMLVAPIDPQIRKLHDDFRLVNHAVYDHGREDNFWQTSLHLSFTKWIQPLVPTGGTRTIDQDVYLVESVISVRDQGEWVADLDILRIDESQIQKLDADFTCSGSHLECHEPREGIEYTAIDNWEEFLDHPTSVGIFRAHNNWVARLAATSILFQRGYGHCIGFLPKARYCLYCMESARRNPALHNMGESALPSFCLD